MKTINYLLLLVLAFLALKTVQADIMRDPIGVNVSASSPMSLTVRFADSNGGRFTTTEALFCFGLLENGQCDPATILGRLPANRDLGSTKSPTSSITDVMTIPYSVIRSTVVRAQSVDYSDFFYVRRFTPLPGVDLGAGPGVEVYARVTCHLAGPATVPLSLTKVSVYGKEADRSDPVRLIRLNESNAESGRVEARVEHTGTGILEGWWEVRQPGDPRLQPIDLLPEGALPEAQRGLQQRFLRLQRFRVQATTTGTAIVTGPRYRDLPQIISGRHELLLRFDATIGRENRARLEVEGESRNLFSGGVAGFAIPILEYMTPAGLNLLKPTASIASRLIADVNDSGQRVWRLAWRPQKTKGLVLEFTAATGQRRQTLIAPAAAGALDFPSSWENRLPQVDMKVTLMSGDGQTITDPEQVRY